jgi:chromosome segregation ATPase
MRLYPHRPTAAALRAPALGLALLVLAGATAAQNSAGGIYSCVDSKGRRLTSDRPIPECLDREQRELGKTGIVKRVVPPSYTADERARIDAQKKAEDMQRARVAEEKRRDRALMVRYPNQAMHDKERTDALAQIDEVVNAVTKRQEALARQRKEIDTELEFYQGDVKKAPSWLQRKLEDNEQQVQIQKRFLGEQSQEKQRINGRFDEELAKLKQLWANGLKP